RYVQVLGGPTRAAAAWSVLIRALVLDEQRSVPAGPGLELVATVNAGNASARATGTTDATGQLEPRFELGAAALGHDPWLRVESLAPPRVLAEGRASLDPAR